MGVVSRHPYSPACLDAINTYYGRGDIPIGMLHKGKTPEEANMIRVPATRTRSDGSFVYPHDLTDGKDAPEATGLLRRVLSKEKDGTVVIVQVGFSTNLARLLDSRADDSSPLDGRALVKRKVRLLSIMGGAFPEGKPEYNIETDVPSAKKLLSEWPTPIVASGYEIGNKVVYPASSILKDYGYVADHPWLSLIANTRKCLTTGPCGTRRRRFTPCARLRLAFRRAAR